MMNTPRIEKNVKFMHTKRNKVVTPSEYLNVAGFKIMLDNNGKRMFPNTKSTGQTFLNVAGFRIMIDQDQKKGAVRNARAPRQRSFEAGGFRIVIDE